MPAPPDATTTSRSLPLWLIGRRGYLVLAGAMAALAIIATILALSTTGELLAAPLLDPGAVVRYGLPISRAVHDIAAAVTIGTAVLAAFALPGNPKRRGVVGFHQWRAARWGAIAASLWALASCAVLIFTTANTVGISLSDPTLGRQIVFYITELQAGQHRLLSFALILATAGLLFRPRRMYRLGLACVTSLLALLPLALSGHAAGADEHPNAVNSLGVHLVGVTVWIGGLVALCVLAPRLGEQLETVTRRYSRLALVAYVLVALSGVVNGMLRLYHPMDLLTTPYGRLLAIKILAFVALGVAGWMHRERIIPSLTGPAGPRRFVRLAVGEAVVMALTVGVSVGMAASRPPVSQEPVTFDAQHAMLGYAPPPPLTVANFFVQFQPDWMLLAALLAGAIVYLRGVQILRRRGVHWPVHRTATWLGAMVLLAWTTTGGPAYYGRVHFSTHMIQHMGLMMVIPLLVVVSAPVLLAIRALKPRTDNSRGMREWLLAVLQSRYGHLLTRPVVAGTIFAGSLFAFYFTGWFEWALRHHGGHMFMMVHFLLAGYLFFWVLIGVDPGPRKPAHLLRLIVLLATMVFHAFFGISVMALDEVLARDWWHQMGFNDDAALLADQSTGGSIAWGTGELPVVVAALILATQWLRSDERQQRRLDERAARDGDRELHDYNAYLRQLHEQDVAEAGIGAPIARQHSGGSGDGRPPGGREGPARPHQPNE